MGAGTAPRLTGRLADALGYALDVHAGQTRKQPVQVRDVPAIPYVAHLLGVASLVLEAGGDEDLAIAGLLHDTAEDHGGVARLDDIERHFGARVARVVADCSDSLAPDGVEKEPWEVRKARHLARLAHVEADSLVVWAADKVHNGRAIVTDVAVEGLTAMTRFHASPDRVLWYYRENLELLTRRGVTPRLVLPLTSIVDDLAAALGTDDAPGQV